MPDWSIKIVPPSQPGGPAEFQPDIEDADAGDPLEVEQGDLVSWNNTTDQAHWPTVVVVDAQPFQLTSDPIQPNSSSPYFNVTQKAGTTIQYTCRYHSNEQGQLVVVPFGHISKSTT